MTIFKEQSFDQERALYESNGVQVVSCRFEGPADGESALKESRNVKVKDCFFDLRYPFWHDEHLSIEGCELSSNCRAALWYSRDIRIKDTKLHGIKALRECADVSIEGCSIISPEFGWSVRGIKMSGRPNLEGWARQGVLMLNAILTVRGGLAASHRGKGWEEFTDAVIKYISDNCEGVVFLLWGNFARSKKVLIDTNRHSVLEAAHPSPLAGGAFFGCRHFSRTNEILRNENKTPVNWQL